MKQSVFIILSAVLFISSCKKESAQPIHSQDHLIMSVLWYQHSAEMKALYYQSFNWAKIKIDMSITNSKNERPKAVVVDIDETMLDNSPFEAHCITSGKTYSRESWSEWTSMMSAKALPGAVEFSKYAESKGVNVFYISNRSIDDFDVTLKNLQSEKFAFADSLHLLLKTTTSNKEERRNAIRSNYEIVLLVGDNLGDFSELFDDRSENHGYDAVDNNITKFGDLFIVLPNPMYGSWETPILNNQRDLSNKEKYKYRRSNLITY